MRLGGLLFLWFTSPARVFLSSWGCQQRDSQSPGFGHAHVRWHLENIYGKLHVNSRTEAVLKFHSTKSQ